MRVVICVFCAFFGAGLAYFSAQHHKVAGEFRATGIQSTTKRTEIGTVAAKFDAGRHVVAFAVTVVHFEAGRHAAFAGFGAVKTRVGMCVVVLCSFHSNRFLV